MAETNIQNGTNLLSTSSFQNPDSCLAALSKHYSVTLSIDEKSPDMQCLISENALFREKLGEEIENSEIKELLDVYKENQNLKRKLAEMEIEGNDPGSFTRDLINQQVSSLSAIMDIPETIQGDSGSLQKNLKLLAVLSYYWENYVSLLKSHMKHSLRSSQFSAFCMLASSKQDQNLAKQAAEVLENTDKFILQSSYKIKDYLKSLDTLEQLKLSLVQNYKPNKVIVDLKEPILKQKALIDSCVSFLKEKPVSYAKVSDWSAKTLEKGFNIQEKLLKSIFKASTQPHSESKVAINLLKRENMLLYALQEDKEPSFVDKTGEIETIRQLTKQNKELLSHILKFPIKSSRKAVSKILQNLHADTEDLDKELVLIQKEIESETVAPLPQDFSIKKLSNENFLLKKDLAQSEAKLLMIKQHKGSIVDQKLKEKDTEIRKLTNDKQELMIAIENLKRRTNSLSVQVRNTKSVKERYNQINLIHSQRETTVSTMKQQIERQKLTMQNTMNENNKKKLALLKNFKILLEIVKKHEPSFNNFQNIADWETNYDKEAEESQKEIEHQNASLLERIFKLEDELRNHDLTIKDLNEDIAIRDRVMKEVADEHELKSKIISLEKEVNKKSESVKKLEKEIENLNSNIAALQEKNEQLTKNNKLKVQNINQMNKEIDSLKSEKTDLQSNLDQIKAENATFQENIDALNLKIKETDKKLLETQNEHANLTKIQNEKITSLENTIAEKEELILKIEETANRSSKKKNTKPEEKAKGSSSTNPNDKNSSKKQKDDKDNLKKKKSSRKNEADNEESPPKTKGSSKREKKPAKSNLDEDEKKASSKSKKKN